MENMKDMEEIEPMEPMEPMENEKWDFKRFCVWVVENVAYLVVGLILGIVYMKTVGFIGDIPSESMYPNYKVGDRIYVSRLAYINKIPDRQDAIVFTGFFDDHSLIIKRVIAIPGDTIDFKDGKVVLNGEVLEEDYTVGNSYEIVGGRDLGFDYPITIPEGYCFGMGDNREDSCDSRYFGLIELENIVGEAKFKIWGAK